LAVSVRAGTLDPGGTVLVAGAGGGVGQLVTAKLLERGYKVKALQRSPDKAKRLFGDHPNLQAVTADLRDASSLQGAFDGVDAVCSCIGTTAFPSNRWHGDNGPKPTDWISATNLIKAAPKELKRFVFVTSAGVERQKEMPWAILNTFGVLKYKHESELFLMDSGLPYTIIRPSRLTDGPYTSYDLNTLLKATAGSKQDVELAPSDTLLGEASRIAVAEACIQALSLASAENKAFALASKEGEGPGEDAARWDALFTACYPQGAKAATGAAVR